MWLDGGVSGRDSSLSPVQRPCRACGTARRGSPAYRRGYRACYAAPRPVPLGVIPSAGPAGGGRDDARGRNRHQQRAKGSWPSLSPRPVGCQESCPAFPQPSLDSGRCPVGARSAVRRMPLRLSPHTTPAAERMSPPSPRGPHGGPAVQRSGAKPGGPHPAGLPYGQPVTATAAIHSHGASRPEASGMRRPGS